MKQRLFQDLGELVGFVSVILVAFLPLLVVVAVNIVEGF